MTKPPAAGWGLFLPFAAGYFLSYLFRTVNGVAGPALASELALADAALGLLTSTYFLAFGLAQLPLGVALDHWGPRRVEASLLLVAAAGALLFALADGLVGLAAARALIGLGVSACLMASFKAFSLWFPAERLASLTGWVMAAGGLGALAATRPLEEALALTGWRPVFMGLAAVTLVVAAYLYLRVPDRPPGHGAPLTAVLQGLGLIYRSRHFWRYAPMGFLFTGGFMAVQGLWATRWMMSLEGMSRAEAAGRLGTMGLAMLAGFVFMGFFATGLARRGIRGEVIYRVSMAVAVAAFAAITFLPASGALLWPLLGACFSLSNVAYSLVAEGFPASHSGRANTALNLLVFAGAFGLQWGMGVLVDGLQGHFALSEAAAYRATFIALLAGQAAAYLWFSCAPRR